ncbi:MAG: nucleotidyltransferase family protein, partial [Candidatus Omnitrophota bacterium]
MALTKKAARFFFEVLRENQDLPGLKALVRRMRPRDWSSLSVLADTSELSPIFYLRLSALDLEAIDPALRSSLKEAYILNLGRTILREKELSKIVTALNAAGIPAMPLKGPVFSVLLFDDIASRFTFYDLDVLVEHARLKEAEKTLKTIGFAIEMSSEEESFRRRNYFELTWVTQRESLGRLSLDLHWRLSNDVPDENIANEVWSGAKSITV